MKDKLFITDEKRLADRLRREIQKVAQSEVMPDFLKGLDEVELISEVEKPQEQPYVSPIFTMSEEEIIAFVEEFDVKELATLSVAELDRLGEVLGVDPSILAGVEDI